MKKARVDKARVDEIIAMHAARPAPDKAELVQWLRNRGVGYYLTGNRDIAANLLAAGEMLEQSVPKDAPA